MDVRVCGPNLSDQSKGTFHVHADGCRDLRNYGPGGKYGGDMDGMNEMLVKDATVYKVVEATYENQIDENVSDEQSREDIANDYASDFWFAPCCSDIPGGWPSEENKLVFECWMTGQIGSFIKVTTIDDALNWVRAMLLEHGAGKHLSVGIHSADEYTS